MNKIKNKEDYFDAKDIKLSLSKCDADILLYAFYHINWYDYDAEKFGGEDSSAACIHLDDIESQLISEFERIGR